MIIIRNEALDNITYIDITLDYQEVESLKSGDNVTLVDWSVYPYEKYIWTIKRK